MTSEEIDILWQRSLHDSVKEGEQFTRYHFAALVLEEAAKAVYDSTDSMHDERDFAMKEIIAEAIRALNPTKDQP